MVLLVLVMVVGMQRRRLLTVRGWQVAIGVLRRGRVSMGMEWLVSLMGLIIAAWCGVVRRGHGLSRLAEGARRKASNGLLL